MTGVAAESTARNWFNTRLLSIFAGVTYSARARPAEVRRMILRDGMRLALVGVFFGVLATLALTPLMKNLLYGVRPAEPGIVVMAAVVLSAVALLATYIPACRATPIDRVVTLRWEYASLQRI
jgi:hypothetical protein